MVTPHGLVWIVFELTTMGLKFIASLFGVFTQNIPCHKQQKGPRFCFQSPHSRLSTIDAMKKNLKAPSKISCKSMPKQPCQIRFINILILID